MAKRTIGKPMFMADIISYLKIKGHYFGANVAGASSPTENDANVWNLNPYQMNEYEINHDTADFNFRFFVDPDTGGHPITPQNEQLAQLLSHVNYAGVLGHNLATLKDANENEIGFINVNFYGGSDGETSTVAYQQSVAQLLSHVNYAGVLGHNLGTLTDTFGNSGVGAIKVNFYGSSDGETSTVAYQESAEQLVNYWTYNNNFGQPEYDGYSLWKIGSISNSDPVNFARIQFQIYTSDGTEFGVDDEGNNKIAKIGALTLGRWFEPEHSFDLKGSITTSYDGIKTQKTIGGNTLSNINHLGVPDWGDLPAWTLQKQEGHDYKIGGADGRRSWKCGLSFIQDENMFHKAGNENKFFTYDEDTEAYTFDSSMASFFKLTLNGNLPFIFCPDSSADDLEFAICRIDRTPSFKQVANNLFSTSLSITEVF